VVLPFSILANRSTAELRARLDAGWHRLAILALPEGVFRPFGGAAGRAVLLWLERRGAPDHVERPCRWGELSDPGYDVRARSLRRTTEAEVEARVAGEGFQDLPGGAWTPAAVGEGVRVGSLGRLRQERAEAPQWVADLADADRSTGELLPRPVAADPVGAARVALHPGDVVVARMRPNLGNVALVPPGPPGAGSPEWIVLSPEAGVGPWLLHALRTPTWRGSLPVATGQTRPRTHADAVVASAVAWPGEALAEKVGALSSRWMAERAELRDRLLALQAAVDAFAAGEIDRGGLAERVSRLEAGDDIRRRP
jgi:hypothetical protein